ncbi:MAG: FecR domain-containing protein [Pseudomonadota bacterium]
MFDPEAERLLDEAAGLFLRLRERPQDKDLLRARRAFLERGPAEQHAYEKIARAYKASEPRRRTRTLPSIAVFLALALSAYFAGPTLRISLLADVATGRDRMTITLASGDIADLDATTALIDRTKTGHRDVELLQGAGFFTVTSQDRPFTVSAAGLEAKALGTAFEVARFDDDVSIAVFEGVVEVSDDRNSWVLDPGTRLHWSGSGVASLDRVDPATVASWRQDRLVSVGMSFEHVADVINRRLAGSIFVMGEDLAAAKVTGSFDLSRPHAALRVLAATQEASIVSALPAAALLLPEK